MSNMPVELVTAGSSRGRRRTRIALIVITVLWVLALLPAGAFALMSPFAFDSGTSDAAWRVFVGLIAMPFVLVFSTIIAWILFALKKHRASILAALLPVVYFVVFLIVA